MAIDVLKTAAVGYQGGVSNAVVPKTKELKMDSPKETGASEQSSQAALNSDVKQIDTEGKDPDNSSDRKQEGSNNNKQLQDAVDKLKEKMNEQTEAVFGIHEGTNRVMIKIVDRNTKDVIKEYPPEKTLDMIQKVWEMAGIMVDEKR